MSAAPLGILGFVKPALEKKSMELFYSKTSSHLVLAKEVFVFLFFEFSFGEEFLLCDSEI